MTSNAFVDLSEAIHRWRLWSSLSWQEIRTKYRRTLLGPLWITIGLGTLVGMLGVIYPGLFGIATNEYVPYLCMGFTAWFFLSSLINEGCYNVLNAIGLLKQMRLPISMFAFQCVARNLIVFAHNLLVYAVVYFVLDIDLHLSALLFFPAVLIYILTGIGLGISLGILCVRFRDIPQLVTTALQILFFLTPIFWRAEDLPERSQFILANPFYHYVEILRAPLLGGVAQPLSWQVTVASTVVIWAIALYLNARFRHRVAFWL